MYIKSRALELLFPNGPVIMWLGAKSQVLRERYWSAFKLIFFILVSNEQKVLESGVAAPESSQLSYMHACTNMAFFNQKTTVNKGTINLKKKYQVWNYPLRIFLVIS